MSEGSARIVGSVTFVSGMVPVAKWESGIWGSLSKSSAWIVGSISLVSGVVPVAKWEA